MLLIFSLSGSLRAPVNCFVFSVHTCLSNCDMLSIDGCPIKSTWTSPKWFLIPKDWGSIQACDICVHPVNCNIFPWNVFQKRNTLSSWMICWKFRDMLTSYCVKGHEPFVCQVLFPFSYWNSGALLDGSIPLERIPWLPAYMYACPTWRIYS